MMFPLLHHGAIIVGLPYNLPELTSTQSGGTPYGATHVAGVANNNPISAAEKTLAIAQGQRLAEIALKLLA
jgi:NAD(P)H dehydrogenase (quinone)